MEIEEIEKMAIEVMEKRGSHSAQVMMEIDGSITVMVLVFDNRKQKEILLQEVREFISAKQVKQYFVIMDTWMRMINKEQVKNEPYMMPSQAHDRKEALVIQEFSRDDDYNIKTKMIMKPFERETVSNKEKIIWLKEQRLDDMDVNQSLWNFFMEKEGVDHQMDKSRDEWNDTFLKHQAKRFSKKYYPKFMKAKTHEEKMTVIDKMMAEMEAHKEKMKKLAPHEGEK